MRYRLIVLIFLFGLSNSYDSAAQEATVSTYAEDTTKVGYEIIYASDDDVPDTFYFILDSNC